MNQSTDCATRAISNGWSRIWLAWLSKPPIDDHEDLAPHAQAGPGGDHLRHHAQLPGQRVVVQRQRAATGQGDGRRGQGQRPGRGQRRLQRAAGVQRALHHARVFGLEGVAAAGWPAAQRSAPGTALLPARQPVLGAVDLHRAVGAHLVLA